MKNPLLAASLAVFATAALSASGTTACGEDVCKQADKITKECVPPTPTTTQPGVVDATKRSCEDETEAQAKCIVDNEDAYCAFVKNPSGADPNNAYSKCAAGAD